MKHLSTNFPLGIHENIDIKDYHADTEYISSSAIKEARKSLKHFHWYLNNKGERKSHFDFGNAFEIKLIDEISETKEFYDKVLVFDDTFRPDSQMTMASKANKEWKENIFKTDKYIINKSGDESFNCIEEMIKECKKNDIISRLLKNTNYQTSLFWEDKQTGIKLKTRPDFSKAQKSVLVDVKTAKDASPVGFAKDAANFDYPLQAAIQIRGCIETGLFEKIDKYYWLVVEKTPPYNVQIYCLKTDDWAFADKQLDYLLGLIKQARESNNFEGYSQQSDNKFGILELELPSYYKR